MTAVPPPINPLVGAFNSILRQLQRLNVSMRRMTQGPADPQQTSGYALGLSLEYRTVRLFQNIIGRVDDLQQKSLGVGLNLDDTFRKVNTQLINLPGGIVAGMDSVLDAMQAGFKEPTAATLKLAIQARTANQNAPKMLATLARIEEFGSFYTEQLQNSIRNFVTTYGVNSEVLVDALGDLTKEFPKFSVLGISEQVSLGVTELVASMGKEFREPVVEMLKGLTQVGIEGAMVAGKVGITQERLAIQSAKTSQDVINALVSASNKSAGFVNQYAKGTIDGLASLGQITEVLGADFLMSAKIIDNKLTSMGGQFIKAVEENTIYANSLSNFLNQLYDPFYKLAIEYMPKIIEILSKDWFKEISQVLVGAISLTIGGGILRRLLGGAGIVGAAARFSFPLATIISTALVGIHGLIKNISGESEKANDNTLKVADETKKAVNSNFMASEYSRQLNDRHQKSFEAITSMNAATLEAIRAKDQTDQFNELIKEVKLLGEKLERNKVPSIPLRGK